VTDEKTAETHNPSIKIIAAGNDLVVQDLERKNISPIFPDCFHSVFTQIRP
tara:strand:+ start:1165 stop:1317 length:153 start_codon:yes stop_codon:yes gene_type:complete